MCKWIIGNKLKLLSVSPPTSLISVLCTVTKWAKSFPLDLLFPHQNSFIKFYLNAWNVFKFNFQFYQITCSLQIIWHNNIWTFICCLLIGQWQSRCNSLNQEIWRRITRLIFRWRLDRVTVHIQDYDLNYVITW